MVVETVLVLMMTVFVVLMRNFEITLNNIGTSRWRIELVVVVVVAAVVVAVTSVYMVHDVYPDCVEVVGVEKHYPYGIRS